MGAQGIIYFIILTLLTMVGFVSLVRNVIKTIRFSTLAEDAHYLANQWDRTQNIAVLFFFLFLGWLLAAGYLIGHS